MSKKSTAHPNPAKNKKNSNVKAEPSALAGIKIDNVNKSLWQYIRKRKRGELVLFLLITLAWEAATAFVIIRIATAPGGDTSGAAFSLLILMAPPVLIMGFWYYRLKKQFEAAFLQEFAETNNFSFDKNGTIDETYGTLFRLSDNQTVSDVVSGSYAGSALRLFLYKMVISSGRSEESFRYTVAELDFQGQLPYLMMVSKHHILDPLSYSGALNRKNVISLEGDFNNYFTLYGDKGNEIEALEVFSPDTMALMEDESANFIVEFVGNRIYIYSSGYVVTSAQLSQIFNLAKKLTNKISPLAKRLQHDSAIVAAPVNLNQTSGLTWLTGKPVVIASCIIGFIGGAMAIILSVTMPNVTPSSYQTTADNSSSSSSNPEFDAATNKASSLDANGTTTSIKTGSQIIAAGQQALKFAKTNDEKELAYYWIGDGYFWEGNDKRTVSYEQKALQYADDAYAYIMEAQSLVNLGKYANAIAATNKAIKLDPSISSSYRIKAFALKDSGQKQKALDAVNIALTIDTKASNKQFIAYDKNDIGLVNGSATPITIRY